jgi:hypothetical protein
MADEAQVAEGVADKYEALRPHLDERQRRLLLGAEARQLGRGGIKGGRDRHRGAPGHGCARSGRAGRRSSKQEQRFREHSRIHHPTCPTVKSKLRAFAEALTFLSWQASATCVPFRVEVGWPVSDGVQLPHDVAERRDDR